MRVRPGSRWRRSRRGLGVAVMLLALVAPACSGGDRQGPRGGRSTVPSADTSPGTGTGTSDDTGTTPGSAGAVALGAKWDWGRFTEFEPFLKTMAGGRTYYEVVWCDVEQQKGSPDWSTLDRVAQRTQQVGVTLMLKLRVGRCWATGGGDAQYQRGSKKKTESVMPQDMGAYRAWVRSAVTRYSAMGVHEYAIENEINSKSFWGGTPEQFVTLAESAAAEIRAADKNALVVDAGLSSTSYGYGLADWLLRAGREADAIAAYNRYYERRFGTRGDQITEARDRAGLEAALTSEQGARNLTYLKVMEDLAKRKVVDVRQIHFYEMHTSVPDLFAFLRATTPASTPIEAWEVGSFFKDTQSDSAERSQEVLKTMSLVLAEGARVAVWLPLAFDPGGRNSDEPRYGLLEPDGAVRESGKLFQAMVEAARGAKAVKVAHGTVTGVGFEKNGTTTAFVWADKPATLTLKPGESAVPAGGTGAGSTGRVTVGSAPMQLRLKSDVKTFLEAQ